MKFLIPIFLILVPQAFAVAPRPLSLTLSGGVSLASYETGFIYYLTHQLETHKSTELKIVTGTSAGSINGVISILNACAIKTPSPHESLNWQVWMPLGIRELADPSKVTAVSLFSGKGVERYSGLLRKQFLDGLRQDCDVVLGIAVTRKDPIKEEPRPGLIIDRYNEYFVLRIKGQGPGHAPKIENFPLGEAGQRQLFLPLTDNDVENYAQLESVATASAMFPLAFPAQLVRHCDLPSTSTKSDCTAAKSETKEFIDGGFFNNTPIGLAPRIAHKLLNKKEASQLIYAVVTLDGKTHPVPSHNEDKPSFMGTLTKLTLQFADTAHNMNISESYGSKTGIVTQTYSNDKLLPRASQYFVAFTGFLDRGFREYDFYLGMFEAHHYVEKFFAKHENEGLYQFKDNPEWRPYFCFLETYDHEPRAKSSCEPNDPKSQFAILMKVNGEIVKNRCQVAGKEAKEYQSCSMVENFKSESSFEKDETDQKFFYRRLSQVHYPFELAKSKRDSLEDILREETTPVFKELIKKQPSDERFTLKESLHVAINAIDYQPDTHWTRLGLGSHVEVSQGHRLFRSANRPWFFWEYGLMVRGLDTFLNSNPDGMALGPYIGISSNWTSKRAFWFEPEVAVRGGYNYSLQSDPDVCAAQQSYQASLYCRSVFVQPVVSLGLLSRFRLEVGSIIYLSKHEKADLTLLAEVQF